MAIIEHELVREGDDEAVPLCPTCGYRMEWQECEGYGCDDGMVNVYEEDVINNDPGDEEPCQICEGAGGWWRCRRGLEAGRAHRGLPPETTADAGVPRDRDPRDGEGVG